MNTATLKIAIEVDDKGSVKLRQVGKDAAAAGETGAKGFDRMAASAASAEKSTSSMGVSVKSMGAAVASLATAIGAVKIAKLAQDAALAYARYETLGAAMVTVGNNAGYTASQMDEYEKKLRSTGIAMTESRETLTKMAASHIDLAKATDLARIAQDAAVVGNINSSEAFDRMINGIRSAEVEVLRGIGLNVNFEESYKKLGAQLGKNAQDLTETEKTQARVNVVVAAGVGIAGTYEAAMGTTGKMVNSMKRYTDDLKVSLGEAFSPALKLLVDQMTVALKEANTEVVNGRTDVQNWGREFAISIIGIEKALIRLSQFIDRVGGTMTTLIANAGRLYDLGANVGGAVSDMFSGIDSGWSKSAATQAGERWNRMYAERSAAAEKMYTELEKKEASLKASELTGISTLEQARTKASESALIKKGLEAKTAQEAGDKEAAAMKSAEAAHKKAVAAAKDHTDELQRLVEQYLPLNAAQEAARKAEAGLIEARKTGLIPTEEELAQAIAKVREELEQQTESITGAKKHSEELADAYEKVSIALMSDSEKRVYALQKENAEMIKLGEKLAQNEKYAGEFGDTWKKHLGEKLARDIQAVNEEASESTKLFEDMAKNIQSAFSGMFEDLISGTGNMLDNLGNLFKKLLAQMATMAIAQPIIIPVVIAMGGAMGVSQSTIAKSLGMDVSGLSGGAGVGGIGSLFSFGNSSIAGSASSLLGNWGSDLAFSGNTTLGGGLLSASSWLSNNPVLGSGLLSGAGSLLMSALSGKLTTSSIFQAGGAALGSVFWPLGSIAGGLLGNVLGGLFGKDDPEFEFHPTINKSLDKTAYAAYLKDGAPGTRRASELDFGGSWNASTNNLDSTFVESMIGKGTMTKVFAAWGQSVVAIQEQFNGYVDSLAKALPEGVAESLYDTLAATDFSAILETASKGRWKQKDAEEALEEVLTKYGEAMLDTLGDAVGAGITAAIDAQGAGSLVGSDEVWGLLTTSVQENIEKSLRDAATAISGGDLEGGLGQVQAVQEAVAAIGSAMAPISEIIDTAGLSDYELSLRAVNQQFDQYAEALTSAGVDLAKYTDLEAARSISLQKIIDQENERLAAEQAILAASRLAQTRQMEIQIMDLSGDAAGALAAQRQDELAALDESLRPLQERIYALQDEATAEAEAAQLAASKHAIEIQIMELSGDAAGALAAQRQDELAALDESLRPLQERIYALQDEATAQEKINQIIAAKAEVGDIVATAGMDDVEKQIRAVDQRFGEIGKNLTSLGVVLADYPDYWKAWEISLNDVLTPALQNATDASIAASEALGSLAERALETALEAEKARTAQILQEKNAALDAAKEGLQKAFAAEQDRLEAVYQAKANALRSQLDTEKDSLSELASLASSLENTISGMRLETDQFARASRDAARAQLLSAIAAAKSGNFTPAKDLGDSLSTLSTSDTSLYANATDYQSDFWATYNSLSELKGITEDQATDAEKTVQRLEKMIDANDAWRNAESKLLATQLDQLLQVDQTVLSVGDAVKAFNEAQAAQVAAAAVAAEAEAAAQALEDAKADRELKAQWDKANAADAAANSILSSISAYSLQSALYAQTQVSLTGSLLAATKNISLAPRAVASFAVGTDYVPMDMVANIHAGERIVPAAYNRSDADNASIVAELRELRAQVAEMARSSRKTAQALETWDNTGMPEERVA